MILCILRRHTPSACVHIRLFDLLLQVFHLLFSVLLASICDGAVVYGKTGAKISNYSLHVSKFVVYFYRSSFSMCSIMIPLFCFVSIYYKELFVHLRQFFDKMLIEGAFSQNTDNVRLKVTFSSSTPQDGKIGTLDCFLSKTFVHHIFVKRT